MAFFPARSRMIPQVRDRRRRQQGGSAMIEFVLATGLLIVPIFFGIITVGLSLVLANQVTEVCRDTGHMFAYGVDMSQSTSQLLVTSQLAQGLGMTPTAGRGVIYLSTVTYVDGTSCTAAGFQANSASCPNINQTVVIKRIVIGNTGIRAGTYAPSITPAIITSSGNIGSANYLKDSSVRAANFQNVISLSVGQYAYASEMFVNPPGTGLWALFNTNVVGSFNVF
jgi:Flp pilus assembly protein TadG